jgi:hypothetical protein
MRKAHKIELCAFVPLCLCAFVLAFVPSSHFVPFNFGECRK